MDELEEIDRENKHNQLIHSKSGLVLGSLTFVRLVELLGIDTI